MLKSRSYNYLISYAYSRKAGEILQYTESGTGRTFLTLPYKIKTKEDIIKVENILADSSNIENLIDIHICGFNRIKSS